MKKLKVTCKQCQSIVYRSPSSKTKFCSQECYWASIKGVQRKPDKLCKYCGNLLVGRQRAKGYAKYCDQKCYFADKKNPFIIKKGYRKVLIPFHPRSDGKGYVFEHIIILENKLGRPLKKNEVTHHIDYNKLNNHPDNLMVYASNTDHLKNAHNCLITPLPNSKRR